MKENNIMAATGEDSSSIALLLGIQDDPVRGFLLLYLLITVLSIVVFKLGFAKKLPPLKTVVIYLFLIIGCIPLAFFGIGLPVAEGLIAAALILIIYKVRLHQSKKEKAE
ncbi:YlaH-like family protein [Bacillus sp. NEB1478]|uniref:YlaH-like family protein n=1 Tax=Bacillus sp. NEB1478 TaxID=3073816 RepID=UPI0037C16087